MLDVLVTPSAALLATSTELYCAGRRMAQMRDQMSAIWGSIACSGQLSMFQQALSDRSGCVVHCKDVD